ncbi:MAG TPA: 50S ribosomal protein L24 [Nitrososphaerales archaeon]|nr:50S ribosomal protein L24 [Nitrososphaerales archaeon]
MKKFGSSLSRELREKHALKAVRPVKGDGVRIVRGGFKGIEGKITRVDPSLGKVFVEGVTREKIAGGKTGPVPIDASKVVVTSLNLEDKIRKARVERASGSTEEAT